MKIAVGIDFGLVRTGIAISDTNQIISSPLQTIKSKDLISFLKKLNLENPFDTIVIGFPKQLNGQDSHITENVKILKDHLSLEFKKVKIMHIDERFTSKMASRIVYQAGLKKKQSKNKELVDQISASIILQDYINNYKTQK